jgi:hypothetical protein
MKGRAAGMKIRAAGQRLKSVKQIGERTKRQKDNYGVEKMATQAFGPFVEQW